MNNPLMYNDPNGEFFVFLGLGVLFWKAVIIGAAVGLASYSIGVAISGQKWTIGGALKSMFFGAVSGAVTFGIGDLFQVGSVVKAVGNAKFLVQGMAHGIAQGVLSVVQGGDFWSGAAAGFLGHMGGELWGATMKGVGLDKFSQSIMGKVAFGAISGGIGAELSGGNFWQGAVTGGIVAGLNGAMQHIKISPYKFLFNGSSLELVDKKTGKVVYSVKANSGNGTDMNNPDSQMKENTGPIPEGDYFLELKEGVPTERSGGGWGKFALRLNESFMTKISNRLILQRGGFFLHQDGNASLGQIGSAGCIAIETERSTMRVWNSLKEMFNNGYNKVQVEVSYPRLSPIIYKIPRYGY